MVAEADLIRHSHWIAEVPGLHGDEPGYLLGKVAEGS
jgi:hypothetical protein